MPRAELAASLRRIALALCLSAVGGAAGALLLADLLPAWWWSEVLQHPRPQLAVGALGGGLGIALLSAWRWRWLLLAPAAWAIAGMLPALAGGAAPSAPMLALAVANVHSANPDPAAAVRALLALDADVLLVIEPDHGWRRALAPLRAAYPVHRELLRDDNFGICAYARRGAIAVWQPDAAEVPSLVVTVDGLEILGTHPPPPFSAEYHGWWTAQLGAIAEWAAERPTAVVAGDLNATPWCSAFRRLRRDGRLAGAGGLAAWSPTWLRGTPLAAPIDHILAGPALGLAGHRVGPEIGSDHRPVLVRIGYIPRRADSAARDTGHP